MSEERTKKKGRATPPDGLLLPHIIEAIASSLCKRDDFIAFLNAVPRSLWSPALAALIDVCAMAPPRHLSNEWPHLILCETDVSPEILAMLAKVLPLRLRIDVEDDIREAAPLANLAHSIGPALSSLHVTFDDVVMVDGQGQAIANVLLQQCPRLCQLVICVESVIDDDDDERIELSDLLAAVAHPRLERLTLDLQDVHAAPQLGHFLAAWLSTAPTKSLDMVNVAHMDDGAAIAFCDALQANTTLDKLVLGRVDNLIDFRGRTLPTSLRHLEWDVPYRDPNVDDATIERLAIAVGATRLTHFGCSVFGRVAQCPAAAPMLTQLQSLEVHALPAAGIDALIAGLSTVPALTTLVLQKSKIASIDVAGQLMAALATSCTHLRRLDLNSHAMRRDGVAAVLAAAPRLPQLTWLNVSPKYNVMHLPELLYILMELVAAGRHVRELHVKTVMQQFSTNGVRASIEDGVEDRRAVLRTLAMIHDVPFVLDRFPVDVEPHVVDALGATAGRVDRCQLYLYL